MAETPTDSKKREGFFNFLFAGLEGFLCIAAVKREGGKKYTEEFFEFPKQLDKAIEYVESNMAVKDVYFCPHLLIRPVRKKENVVEAPCAWADLDLCPPDAMLVQPTLVLETSDRKYQAFWKFDKSVNAEDAESISKRIAYFHADAGADKSGWDLTQLLRIPLTYNHKYSEGGKPPQQVQVLVAEPKNRYVIRDFELYPEDESAKISFPESFPDKSAEEILDDHRLELNPRVFQLFAVEPSSDSWSEALWELELSLIESGVPIKEAFIVAKHAACNKYARDGRPDTFLWKEIVRAYNHVQKTRKTPYHVNPTKKQVGPPLLSDEERKWCEDNPTIVEDYIEWAKSLGDAAWQYHQAGAFIVLSTLLTGPVRLPTSFGTLIPNLWFMILADTTLTRKSTSMDIATELVLDVDPDSVLATDGSIEGLLTSLSTRPGRPSIFLRDEFTGLMEAVSKREYYSGMLETLTKLYDGKFMRRQLRKETIEVKDPILILFAGGIKTRMQELLTHEHVASGFIPRFVMITAEADVTKLRPLGPPTQETNNRREELVQRFRRMRHHYWKPSGEASGTKVNLPKQWDAKLTDDAWFRYNQIEHMMLMEGVNSMIPDIMTPTMDRLTKSGLKAAILLAASRCEDNVVITEQDIVRAFYYVEQWREHTIHMINSIGTTSSEKALDRIAGMIKSQPGIMRSDIMRMLRLSAREADASFATLEQRGVIARSKVGRSERYHPVEF